jgi:hypothetical protein
VKRIRSALGLALLAPLVLAQAPACPEKNVNYWQK